MQVKQKPCETLRIKEQLSETIRTCAARLPITNTEICNEAVSHLGNFIRTSGGEGLRPKSGRKGSSDSGDSGFQPNSSQDCNCLLAAALMSHTNTCK